MKKSILLLLTAFLYASCSIVPLTGRNQLAIFTTQDLMPLVKDEYKESLKESKVLTSTQEGQEIVKVGNKMAEAVELYLKEQGYDSLVNELDWEFNLLEDEEVNAWCMPGGKVAFYTGILPFTKDETGVAVIMGHELAHAVANHAGERMSQEILMELGVGTLDLAMGQFVVILFFLVGVYIITTLLKSRTMTRWEFIDRKEIQKKNRNNGN